MDAEAAQRIRLAAEAAAQRVWDDSVIPEHGPQPARKEVENRASDEFLNAVRGMCAELGIDEQDYYLADPYAAEVVADRLFWPDNDREYRRDEDWTMNDHVRHDDVGRDEGLGY